MAVTPNSFATPDDVRACFRELNIDETTAAVNQDKIQGWLNSAHQFVLGKFYTLYARVIDKDGTPLSFEILKEIEAFKVAGIVDDVLNSYSEADKKPQWEKRAMMMLNQYIPEKDSKTGYQPEPNVKLPDAQYVGTSSQTGRISVQSTGSRIFTKGGNNW